ncbi:MAG: hypothetical protein ABI162_08395 [Luteolibacter sp.]
MKSLPQSLAFLALVIAVTNCADYVEHEVTTPATSTSTTTRTTTDSSMPGAVTTERKTTTTNY